MTKGSTKVQFRVTDMELELLRLHYEAEPDYSGQSWADYLRHSALERARGWRDAEGFSTCQFSKSRSST